MKNKGFTLIEMMITMAIIAILASVATMSYTQYVLRANRADAKIALMQLAQRQERFFTENLRYAADFRELFGAAYRDRNNNGFAPGAVVLWVDDSNGSYDTTVDNPQQDYSVAMQVPVPPGVTPTTFLLAATAGSTRQLKDEKCLLFSIDQTGNQLAFDSTGTQNTQECWGR